MRKKLTPKHRVLKVERGAYAKLVMMGMKPVEIAVSLTSRRIGIGFTAAEAWADAARRLHV